MLKFLILLFSFGLSFPTHAFNCFLTIAKDSCWLNYNVTVDMIDTKNGKTVASVVIPEGQAWTRIPFGCQPDQSFSFQAKFSPAFWNQDTDKVYPGHHYWSLPKLIKKGEAAWNLTICYPNSFSGVPLPPDASGQCLCNIKNIPAVEPQ